MPGIRSSTLVWRVFAVILSLGFLITSWFVIGVFRQSEGEAVAAVSMCDCFVERPIMYIVGMPKSDRQGTLILYSGDTLLRDCTLKVCNCMSENINTNDLVLDYGTTDFSNEASNFEDTVELKDVPGFGSEIGKGEGVYSRCSLLFDLFEKEGAFPDAGDDHGKVYINLKYKDKKVSTSSWEIDYKHIREVDTS